MIIDIDKALSVITAAFNIVEVKAGFGRHVEFLTPGQVIRSLEYASLSETMFILSLIFSKISICVFLLRLPRVLAFQSLRSRIHSNLYCCNFPLVRLARQIRALLSELCFGQL